MKRLKTSKYLLNVHMSDYLIYYPILSSKQLFKILKTSKYWILSKEHWEDKICFLSYSLLNPQHLGWNLTHRSSVNVWMSNKQS